MKTKLSGGNSVIGPLHLSITRTEPSHADLFASDVSKEMYCAIS